VQTDRHAGCTCFVAAHQPGGTHEPHVESACQNGNTVWHTLLFHSLPYYDVRSFALLSNETSNGHGQSYNDM
jgi:hypothetical protein